MRVVPEAMPLKVYGFKKVSKTEMEDIVNRLQRPTHCTESQNYSGEMWQASNVLPRAPFTLCRRTPSPADPTGTGSRPGTSKALLNSRVLQKIVRRLQRPTISTMAAEGTIAPNYELEFGGKVRSETPRNVDEQEKLLERIQRPTTASRRKLFGHMQCLLCEDLQYSDVHETLRHMRHNEVPSHSHGRRPPMPMSPPAAQPPPEDAATGRASRARSATHASNGGKAACPRLPTAAAASSGGHRVRVTTPSDLPLISGLARTEKVKDITGRLHPTPLAPAPGTTSRPTSRPASCLKSRVPSATPIEVYG